MKDPIFTGVCVWGCVGVFVKGFSFQLYLIGAGFVPPREKKVKDDSPRDCPARMRLFSPATAARAFLSFMY